MKIKLGRIPLPNKPPKIIGNNKRQLLEELEEREAVEEMDEIYGEYEKGGDSKAVKMAIERTKPAYRDKNGKVIVEFTPSGEKPFKYSGDLI